MIQEAPGEGTAPCPRREAGVAVVTPGQCEAAGEEVSCTWDWPVTSWDHGHHGGDGSRDCSWRLVCSGMAQSEESGIPAEVVVVTLAQ